MGVPRTVKNPGVNEKAKKKDNPKIRAPTINSHRKGPMPANPNGPSKPTCGRPRRSTNKNIPNPFRFIRVNKPPTQGIPNNIIRPVKPRL